MLLPHLSIHTQSVHRKGIAPIPPADESAAFPGPFLIESALQQSI